MRRLAVTTALTLCACVVTASEPQAAVQEPESLEDVAERFHAVELARIERYLAGKRNDLKSRRPERRTAAKREIPLVEEELRRFKTEVLISGRAFDVMNPQIGDFGTPKQHLEVLQIIDEETMLVVPRDSSGDSGRTLLVKGVPTTKIVDGVTLGDCGGLLEVTGTARYENVTGATTTVFVLRLRNVEKLKKALLAKWAREKPEMLARLQAAKTDRNAKVEPQGKSAYRMWADASGTYRIEAEFAGYGAGNVRLKKPDGSEISLPLEKLSQADQEWIRSRAR